MAAQVTVNPQHNAKNATVSPATAINPASGDGWMAYAWREVKASIWTLVGKPASALGRVFLQWEPLDRVGYPVSMMFLAAAVYVLYLSLDHLTWAVNQISARGNSQAELADSFKMAVTIDVILVLSEVKIVIDLLRGRGASVWSWVTVVSFIFMSAGMNAWAFSHSVMEKYPTLNPLSFPGIGGDGFGPFAYFWASVVFGVFVPFACFVSLKQATELWYKKDGAVAKMIQSAVAQATPAQKHPGNGLPNQKAGMAPGQKSGK